MGTLADHFLCLPVQPEAECVAHSAGHAHQATQLEQMEQQAPAVKSVRLRPVDPKPRAIDAQSSLRIARHLCPVRWKAFGSKPCVSGSSRHILQARICKPLYMSTATKSLHQEKERVWGKCPRSEVDRNVHSLDAVQLSVPTCVHMQAQEIPLIPRAIAPLERRCIKMWLVTKLRQAPMHSPAMAEKDIEMK